MQSLKRALVFALLCTSMPAWATPHWYAGAGFGSGHSDDATENANDIAAAMSAPYGTYTRSRGTFNLFGGYRFNRYIGIELGYTDFGTYNLTAIDLASNTTYSESDNISALSVAAVWTYPVSRAFSLFYKLGLAFTNDSETCSSNSFACPSHSSTGVNPVLGIGGSVNVSREVSINLEFDEYSNVGNSYWEYTAGTFSVLNASALYRF
ncbi:MAG: outer membrane beta-barrel protein [Acidiferrobacter sp.]